MSLLNITDAEAERLVTKQSEHTTYVTFSIPGGQLILPTPRWALAELAAMRGINLDELLK
jgi:hypothetical protein